MRRQILWTQVGLDLHDAPLDAAGWGVVDQAHAQQLRRHLGSRAIKPGSLLDQARKRRDRGRRSHGFCSSSAISLGTKGRTMTPKVGMSVVRKKSTRTELFMAL